MTYQPQLIRRKVAEILTGATDAGANVIDERIDPRRENKPLPALIVSIPSEAVTDDSAGRAPLELEHDVDIQIEGWVARTAHIDDEMDALSEQIEAAMHEDPYLGGTVGGEGSRKVDRDTQVDLSGQRTIGLVTLTYRATYFQLAPEPPLDSELDDFQRVHAEHDINGETHVDDQAVDDFTVQE